MKTCPRIVITAGEPAGIGPDLCLDIAQYALPCELIVIADPDLLQQRADELGIVVELKPIDLSVAATPSVKNVLRYLPVSLAAQCVTGELNNINAQYVLDSLQIALDGCLDNTFDAVVTAPVHKGVINDASVHFTGHTEFFAEGAGIEQVVMMLATQNLKVALATTHLPLKAVSSAITVKLLTDVINIIDTSFKTQFGIPSARIAVCGLNPHAGEGGHLGMEEIEIIDPVINNLKNKGLNVSGSWPADTIFVDEKLRDYDVVLAMFHDQGLPVLKHHGFGKAVNVTLGLPFIRTSVDHGTALDLAGTGKASASSLQAAIEMAITMLDSKE